MNKKLWALWFVAALGLFGVWEFISIYDGNEDTYTLTSAIINYVHPSIFWGVLAIFGTWFIYHFVKYYRKVPKWRGR